jgi:23S rRNA pseudouridine955/2504/2580 synthase
MADPPSDTDSAFNSLASGVSDRVSAQAAGAVRVDEESHGQRLDNFLIRELKGVPKTHIYRIIRSGEVRINKGRVKADSRVSTGDTVRIPPIRLTPVHDVPAVPARSFPVLFEDAALLAIDKPAGVAVHGGSGVSFGVIEQLRRARPAEVLLELVHRLDRETSGVLLIAKKRSALRHVQDQFRSRETAKTYMAAVKGRWPDRLKVIDVPLVKYVQGDGERRVRVAERDDPEGMRSISIVTVVARHASWTLLEVTIKTGRTHQIRVHLASSGHPILGDDKYGDFELNRQLQHAPVPLRRMFLHAWRLQVQHPVTGVPVALQAALPAELKAFIHDTAPDL